MYSSQQQSDYDVACLHSKKVTAMLHYAAFVDWRKCTVHSNKVTMMSVICGMKEVYSSQQQSDYDVCICRMEEVYSSQQENDFMLHLWSGGGVQFTARK